MAHLLPDTRFDFLPDDGSTPALTTYRDSRSTASVPVHVREDHHEGEFERLYDVRFDPDYGVYWAFLKADSPKNFTPTLVSALRQGQMEVEARIRRELSTGQRERLRYQVFASRIPGVFSLGGDLALFRRMIRTRERDALLAYARDCIDLVYTNAVNYKLPVTTISLVQGQALGGGFEAALAANVVVAERHCKMGLPEVMFNMFPGMGAYQLLTRRLSPVDAEKLILSGRTYSAEELHELGLVDVLAETGEGEAAVWSYIKGNHRQFHAHQGLRGAIQAADPLDYGALLRVTEAWVEQAMELADKDLEVMNYLIRAQQKLNA